MPHTQNNTAMQRQFMYVTNEIYIIIYSYTGIHSFDNVYIYIYLNVIGITHINLTWNNFR